MECERCAYAGQGPGVCDRCGDGGLHRTIEPVVSEPADKPLYRRLRDGTSMTRMNEGSIMRELGRGRDLALAMAQQGPRWWLANPTNINHPLVG
jgi:hypothetical protein